MSLNAGVVFPPGIKPNSQAASGTTSLNDPTMFFMIVCPSPEGFVELYAAA